MPLNFLLLLICLPSINEIEINRNCPIEKNSLNESDDKSETNSKQLKTNGLSNGQQPVTTEETAKNRSRLEPEQTDEAEEDGEDGDDDDDQMPAEGTQRVQPVGSKGKEKLTQGRPEPAGSERKRNGIDETTTISSPGTTSPLTTTTTPTTESPIVTGTKESPVATNPIDLNAARPMNEVPVGATTKDLPRGVLYKVKEHTNRNNYEN